LQAARIASDRLVGMRGAGLLAGLRLLGFRLKG